LEAAGLLLAFGGVSAFKIVQEGKKKEAKAAKGGKKGGVPKGWVRPPSKGQAQVYARKAAKEAAKKKAAKRR